VWCIGMGDRGPCLLLIRLSCILGAWLLIGVGHCISRVRAYAAVALNVITIVEEF